MPNEVVAPSCSNHYLIDPELLNNGTKRKLSESESEEYKDQVETSTNKKALYKDSPSNSGYKRSINKINSTNDINKRIKLDNNAIFQKDDYCKRVSKNLTNHEVSMLLELSYNFDDEIIFDYEDKTHIQSPKLQIIMDRDSKNISDPADNFNTSTTDVNDEQLLNNNKANIFTEDKSLSQNSYCSESRLNQIEDISDKFEVNSEKNMTQTYEDNFGNRISNYEEVVIMPLKNKAKDINYISLSDHCDLDVPNVENYEDAEIKSSLVVSTTITTAPTGDQFYFGSESCRDVSIHSTHSLECSEMNNCSRNTSIHTMETNDSLDFRRYNIVQEGKLNEPITHVNKKDHLICESNSNLSEEISNKEIKVNFEGNVTQMYEDKFGNSNPKTIVQEHMLDLTKCINDESMLNNDNSTSIINSDINSEGTSRIFNNQEEEMFLKLLDNMDFEIQIDNEEITQPFGDSIHKKNFRRNLIDSITHVNNIDHLLCESSVTENVFNQDNLSESTRYVYNENVTSIINKNKKSSNNEGVIMLPDNESEDVNDNILSDLCDMDVKNVYSCEDAITNRSLVVSATVTTAKTGNRFYFGSENCCDVSVHIIHPLELYEMNNFSRNTSIHSMETKDFRSSFFQEKKLKESMTHVTNKDESLSQSSFYSENNLNQSENFFQEEHEVNCGLNVTQTYFDNSDPKNTSQHVLDLTKCVNDETMINIDHSSVITNKSINNESYFVSFSSTNKITVSQTCENFIYENGDSKMLSNQDYLSTNFVSDVQKVINTQKESLSLNSSNAEQSSNGNSDSSDDSLLFMPSARDLVKYGIECEENEESVTQSQNSLENNVSYKEIIPQYQSSSLKANEVSKNINTFVSSSYAKDYEDNVKEFYDCELSSIENSDAEDNLLLSFENDSLIDICILDKNQDKLKNANSSTSNELTLVDNNLKTQLLDYPSENCYTATNVVDTPVSCIYSSSHDHQCNETVSASISKKQILHDKSKILKDLQCCEINSDNADNKFESLSQSNVKITHSNTINRFNNSIHNINTIQSDRLCIAQIELKSVIDEKVNLEDYNERHIQNNVDQSVSGFHTQNIIKSQDSYKDNKSKSSTVSSMKLTGNYRMSKFNSEEIDKVNAVKCSDYNIDRSNLNNEIKKKKYLDEIIKNEQLFNNSDEELSVDDLVISPYITQSLVKSASSQNLKNGLTTNAAAIVNTNSIGDGSSCTDSTQQQTMISDVLHKSLNTYPLSNVLMEDPDGLVVPLMPHQKHAIAWLIWRESQEPHGGILADDMGLGKTLSMISLVLKSKEKQLDNLLPIVSNDNTSNDVFIGGTLVVCPASLLSQWELEVKTKLNPGLLKVGRYYGINRSLCASELAINDLVLTSYNIIMWDFKKQRNSSPLFKIKWNRIILDEAHNIRNYKTQTSVAVCNMMSINRWAITGTPIHNKEADFYTLLKFIRCHPFDDWQMWKQWVGKKDEGGKKRLSLLVKSLMLRRTKEELSQFTTFKLPSKDFHTVEIELSNYERNAYEKLLQFSSNFFASYLYDKAAKEKVFDSSIKLQSKVQYFQEQSRDKEEVFKNHPELLKLFRQFKNIKKIETYHILVLLLRLRQMCCHPCLIKGRITEENIKNEEDVESLSEDDTDTKDNDATNSESHNENTTIVTVSKDIELVDLMSSLTLEDEPVKNSTLLIDSNMIFNKSFLSTKIKAVCDKVREKVLDNGGKEKAIVVSQWPSFLFLIRQNLAHYNVKMEMFSGDVPILKRNKIIREFNDSNSGPQILLLSLKAGGVGLNLMAANHMFLVDIHWNPQLEAQACDRIYRVGQTRPVNVYKFICSNTIETRILNIQSHKLQIAENLFKGSSVVSSKITLADLKQIFEFS